MMPLVWGVGNLEACENVVGVCTGRALITTGIGLGLPSNEIANCFG